MSGELTLRSNGESVHLPDIPQPVISALHEAVIGVRDHIEVFKYRLIAIRIEDIRQIYEMLSQWTHQYNIQSQLTQIIAEHRNAEVGSTTSRKNFRSIEDFLRYDDSNIDPVKLLTVRFSFILKNPNTQRLESYDLTLEFPEAADWRPDLLGEAGVVDHYSFAYRGTETWTFKVRIEYSDYVTAVALQSMIGNWYMTLDGTGRQWAPRKARFYERLASYSYYSVFSPGSYLVRWLPVAFAFLISVSLFPAAKHWLGDIKSWFLLGATFLILTATLELGIRLFISHSDKALRSSSKTPILLLNSGNRKIYDAESEAVARGNEKRRFVGKLLFGSILLSMFVSVGANIVTYFIW